MEVKVNLDETNVVISRKAAPKEMLSVTREGDRTKVRVNSSSLGLIQECSRKAFYSLKEKWRPEFESPATLFGSAIHKALEVFYAGDIAERKMPKWEVLELMSYGHRTDGDDSDLLLHSVRAFVEKADPLKELPEFDKRSIQNGVYTLYHYFKSYIDDPYVAYVDDQGPFIERPFSFTLYQDNEMWIDYFGTIDLVVRHITTGEILVCDHKTSSVVGADFYNRLKPNHQYTGYLMGAKKVFGLTTDSFLINCIQVKAKPLTSRGTPPSFPRQVTTRDNDDYNEFTEAVVTNVSNWLRQNEYNNFPLGHTNACAMYGGCSYLTACSAPMTMRETILKAKFTKE